MTTNSCAVCHAPVDRDNPYAWILVGVAVGCTFLCSRECLVSFVGRLATTPRPTPPKAQRAGLHVILPHRRE
jgi:hypothetical protein